MPIRRLAGPRRPKRSVKWDGRIYRVISNDVEIPNLAGMPRPDALEWLIRNTYPLGFDRSSPRTGIAGMPVNPGR